MAATPISMPAFATWFATLDADTRNAYDKWGTWSEAGIIQAQYGWIVEQAPTPARPPSQFCDTLWQQDRSDSANHWLKSALFATLG